MNTYLMKRAMIEGAISQGIRQMKEDPERSARRLVDLGKQFSNNRFQDTIFSVMQALLDNDRSSYYDMLHNLLKNTDDKAIEKFGVNFGYMGWTYGAAKIRDEEKSDGFCIPWSITFRYDPSSTDGLTVDQMKKIISEGQKLGIYVYFIRENNVSGDYALLELLESCRDCAFVLFSKTGRITAAQIEMLKLCKNTVISLPVDDPESLLTASLLKDQKIFFALHYLYNNTVKEDVLPGIMESTIASEAGFLFGIAEDGTDPSIIDWVADAAYKSRLSQTVPCVFMDFYGDASKISNVICEHPHLLEIDEQGRILKRGGAPGDLYPAALSLSEVLKKYMPAFTAQKDAD